MGVRVNCEWWGWLWDCIEFWWILFGVDGLFNLFGGMMVVFGYTTAMATEQYPEIWLSNKAVLGAFVTGLLMEFFMVYYVLKDKEVEVVFEFNGLGD